MTSFHTILARAELRKGGAEALQALLPEIPSNANLKNLSDDRILAEMTKRIFCSGFVWKVIESKWPAFEAAFLQFDPLQLTNQPNEFWDGLVKDPRIVRNAAKIFSVRENAVFVRDISQQHGVFGNFLSAWPSSNQVELLEILKKQGSRLGGNTGQYLLRHVGWDGFITSKDVVACLRDAGLDIAEEIKSKRDMQKVQTQFNAWADETGLSYLHLSRICALSIGENRLTSEDMDD